MYVGVMELPPTLQPSCCGSQPAPGGPGGTFQSSSGKYNAPPVLRRSNDTCAPVTLGCTTAIRSSGTNDPFHLNWSSLIWSSCVTTYFAPATSWAGPTRVQSSA